MYTFLFFGIKNLVKFNTKFYSSWEKNNSLFGVNHAMRVEPHFRKTISTKSRGGSIFFLLARVLTIAHP